MIHDKKLLGVCGETEQAGQHIEAISHYDDAGKFEVSSWSSSLTASLKVYEYISHYSSPTSLSTITRRIVSTQLDMKNLLHLGEDRYLTTLLLKHFPLFKAQFIWDAHA